MTDMGSQPEAGQPPWWSTTKVVPPKRGRGHKKTTGAPSNKHPRGKAQPHPTKLKPTRGHGHAKKAAGAPGPSPLGGALISQGPYRTNGPIARYYQEVAAQTSVHATSGEVAVDGGVVRTATHGRTHLGTGAHHSHGGRHHVAAGGGLTHASSGHRGHIHSSEYTISDLRRAAGSKVVDGFLKVWREHQKEEAWTAAHPRWQPPADKAGLQGHVSFWGPRGNPPAGWVQLSTGEWAKPGTLAKGDHLMSETGPEPEGGPPPSRWRNRKPAPGHRGGHHTSGAKDSKHHKGASALTLSGTSFLGRSGQSSHAAAPAPVGSTSYRTPGRSHRHM